MKEYDPKYIKLTLKQGEEFIKKNKEKLEANYFMEYQDYYNKAMMNCRNAYDKNWGERIVLRHLIYNDYYELNDIYKEWL